MDDKLLDAIENLQKQMVERLSTIESDVKYIKEQHQGQRQTINTSEQTNIRTI